MAYTSYPFDGQDTTETQYSALFSTFQHSGVSDSYGGTGLAVTADGSAMAVKLAAGSALVRGFYFNNSATVSLSVNVAPSSGTRYDAVVLQLVPATDSITPVVKSNTGITPTLTQTADTWEILLAVVAVTAGNIVLAAGSVTDKRNYIGHQLGVWSAGNRPASPRNMAIGVAADTGPRMELYNNGTWESMPRNWGIVSAFPTTRLAAGDRCIHSMFKSARTDGTLWGVGTEFQWDGSTWRQTQVCLVDTAAERDTIRDTYLTSGQSMSATQRIHYGFEIEETSTGNRYQWQGTDWRPVSTGPGATQTDAGLLVMGAGWTLTSLALRELGMGYASVGLVVVKATSALTVGTDGKVTNTTVATLASTALAQAFLPLIATPVSSVQSGRATSGGFGTTGVWTLSAVGGTTNVAVGDSIQLNTGAFRLADPMAPSRAGI